MSRRLRFSKIAYGILLGLLITSMGTGQSTKDSLRLWSSGTANILPAGRMEVGIFQPLRYGWSETFEISGHPLWFFIIPNAGLKWAHKSRTDWTFSSGHHFYYPTLLLRLISREGIGGIISPEFTIPHMFSLYNEIIYTRMVAKNHCITLKAGIDIAVRFGFLDERSTIDLPLVYNRLAVFYNGYGLRFGGDMRGKIISSFSYVVDFVFFVYPDSETNFFLEHKGLVRWYKNNGLELSAGYLLTYGEYPFGNQWHLLLPLIDVRFGWNL